MPLRKRLIFSGEQHDRYGMPEPYHSYMILADAWKTPRSGVASIVSFSEGPHFQQTHLSLFGGEQGALTTAVQHLVSLHPGLRMLEVDIPSLALVNAWMVSVFPPLLNGLSQELHFLGGGSPTWRFRWSRCEFVRPLREYALDEVVYEQFLRLNPGVNPTCRRHDELVTQLEKDCQTLHSTLIALADFQAVVREIETRFQDWRGAYRPEDATNLLGECAVNWPYVEELVGHTTAAAWKELRPRVLEILRRAPAAEPFNRVQEDIKTLKAHSENMRTALSSLRDRLADEYQIPASVPVVTTPYPEHF